MKKLCSMLIGLQLAVVGCGAPSGPGAGGDVPNGQPGGKADTGWVSSATFELDGLLEGQVGHRAIGAWAELANDVGLQQQLAEEQIKFAKNSLEKQDYHLNQLAQFISILSVETAGDWVTVRYSAEVDMTAPLAGALPSLDQLPARELEVTLPLDPVDVYARAGEACADDWDPYVLAEHKYFYYFAPEKEGCDLVLVQGQVTLTQVHQQRVAYPEYDQLLGPLESGRKGFKAALVPAEAYSTILHHLESELGLQAETVEPGASYRRYRVQGQGTEIVIDLYNLPYHVHHALQEYQLIYYHGHSNYGTQPYFVNATEFADFYQVFMVNACRTYSYYVRQILQNKASDGDPKGWAAADVVANVDSNWISYSARTLVPLMENLLQGMDAVVAGEPSEAPSWQAIVSAMEEMDDVRYGVAGVSTNAWQPPAP